MYYFGFETYEQLREFLMYVDYFDLPLVGKMSIIDTVSFLVNLVIFPAILFQMSKTWQIKETNDFNPYFLSLQLLGCAPEGMIGLIIGYLLQNNQMMAIGAYAMFYNMYMLFFRCFGHRGLVKDIFKKGKK